VSFDLPAFTQDMVHTNYFIPKRMSFMHTTSKSKIFQNDKLPYLECTIQELEFLYLRVTFGGFAWPLRNEILLLHPYIMREENYCKNAAAFNPDGFTGIKDLKSRDSFNIDHSENMPPNKRTKQRYGSSNKCVFIHKL